MKIYTTCLTLLFFIQPLMAQLDSADLQLVHSVIRTRQPAGTIYYSSDPRKSMLGNAIKALSIGPIININPQKDSISLTNDERKYLQKELEQYINIEWGDNLFPDSKRIGSDTIVRFVRRMNDRLLDTLAIVRHTLGNIWFNLNYSLYHAIFFTKPIYIRNRAIAFFHFSSSILHRGNADFRFYCKENDNWVECATLDFKTSLVKDRYWFRPSILSFYIPW